MIRTFAVLAVGGALCVGAVAAPVAPCNQNTWTFTAGSGGAQCGSSNDGVTFTQNNEAVTIYPDHVNEVTGDVKSPYPIDGLFEVGQGENGNLASGLGPFISDNIYGEGYSPFTAQQGIQEKGYNEYMLYIEVSQTGPDPISSGTVLNFLMQEGADEDTFNVFTGTSSTNTVPNLLSLNEICSDVGVNQTCNPPGANKNNGSASSVLAGKATVPQFSVTTSTSAADPYEFIAIEADCDYLLLNSITTPSSTVPEPRFYGLLLAGLLGFAGLVYRKRQAARV